MFNELHKKIDELENRYHSLRKDAEDLMRRVKEVSYYSTEHNRYVTLGWRTCGKDNCVWCPMGHGPYWMVSVYYGKDDKVRSSYLKGITYSEFRRHHISGKSYGVLKPLDIERKKIAQELKKVKDARLLINRRLSSVLKG